MDVCLFNFHRDDTLTGKGDCNCVCNQTWPEVAKDRETWRGGMAGLGGG